MAEGTVDFQVSGFITDENGVILFGPNKGILVHLIDDQGVGFMQEFSQVEILDFHLMTDEDFSKAYQEWLAVQPSSVSLATAVNLESSQDAHQDAPKADHQVAPTTVHQVEPMTVHQGEPMTGHQAEPMAAHQAEPMTAHQGEPMTAHQAEPMTAHQAGPMAAHQAKPTADQSPAFTPLAGKSGGSEETPTQHVGRKKRGRPKKATATAGALPMKKKETEKCPRKAPFEWNDHQTILLLDLYAGHFESGVGPMKRFRLKIDMWNKITADLNANLGLQLTPTQVESRYKTVLKRKREARSHNSETGETRVNVEFEDALDKIKSMDDSIVPEVKRDARTVSYSKFCKSTVAEKMRPAVVNATSVRTCGAVTASGACIPGPSSSLQSTVQSSSIDMRPTVVNATSESTYIAGTTVGAGLISPLVVGPSTLATGPALQSVPSSSMEVCMWPLPPSPSSSSAPVTSSAPATSSPSFVGTRRPLLPFSTPKSVGLKRKIVPLAPATPLSRSSDVSPSEPTFTPFRKRPSASESLMRLIESNQMLRMTENEKKLDRLSQQQSVKEQKENLREERKERHHQEKMRRMDQLCTILSSTSQQVFSPNKTVATNQLVVVNQSTNCTVLSPSRILSITDTNNDPVSALVVRRPNF